MSRNVKRRLNYDGDNNSEDNNGEDNNNNSEDNNGEDNNNNNSENNNTEDNNVVNVANLSYTINLTPTQIVRDCIITLSRIENGRTRLNIKFPVYFKYFNTDTQNFIKNTIREAAISGEMFR
jgi:hypothetical protein